MIRGTLYTGSYVLNSRNGRVDGEAPPLVSDELAEAARAALKRNLRRPKGRTTRTYLLRGLMVCGCCGLYYGGAVVGPKRPTHAPYHYYRCAGMHAYMRPDPETRCRSKALPAEWLEERIWGDVRGFILDPGEPLEEARAELRRRLAATVTPDDQRDVLRRRIAEKEAERELVMTLFRRKKIRLDEAERQLDELAAEADALRAQVAAVQAEQDVTQAFEAQLLGATAMLGSLRAQLADVEATNDLACKRRIIELLVDRVDVETIDRPAGKREARLEVRYVFGRPRFLPLDGEARPLPGEPGRVDGGQRPVAAASEKAAFVLASTRSSAGTTPTWSSASRRTRARSARSGWSIPSTGTTPTSSGTG
jgi:site-specific DNA recombinase